MIRVGHLLGTYLLLSENWIDPQIREVPDTEGAVVCQDFQNAEIFRPETLRTFNYYPARRAYFWRGIEALGRRLGWPSLKLRWELRRWRPHLLHAHFGWCGRIAAELAPRLRVPFVVSFYGADAWREGEGGMSPRVRYGHVFSTAAAVLAEGPAMRERLISLGCPADRVHVIRLGVPGGECRAAPEPRSGPTRVLLLGRFCEKKGLEDGLTACREAIAKGALIEITVVGDSTGDPMGEQIKSRLARLAADPLLAGRVRMLGFISPDKVQAELRAHDVFLCASRFASDGDAEGGSPVILTQAMAQGLACVGTRHCDIPELVCDQVTGWLADSGDITTLARHLHAIAADPTRALAIRSAGIQRVAEKFSRTEQLQQLRNIYRTGIA